MKTMRLRSRKTLCSQAPKNLRMRLLVLLLFSLSVAMAFLLPHSSASKLRVDPVATARGSDTAAQELRVDPVATARGTDTAAQELRVDPVATARGSDTAAQELRVDPVATARGTDTAAQELRVDPVATARGTDTAAQDRKLKALVGGTLIDGFGSRPIRNSVIIIEGERIKAVGQVGTLVVPAGAEIISTEGMTVLPGLWDMHVHLMINGHSDYAHWDKSYPPQMEKVIMPASARQLLLAGVTSVRDLGGPLDASIAVRDRINKGEIPGPTVYISGPFIQHQPYPGTEYFRWGVKGADDARAKVRRLEQTGVDVIKVVDQDQMTMEEFQAVVDEAHKHKLPVVAHSHRPEEIRRGLLAGVDCFEHTGLATAPEYPPDVIALLRERTAKMSLGPLFWTPTVQGLLNYEYVRDNPEQLDDPSWQVGLPKTIIDDIKNSLRYPQRLSYYQITPLRRPTLARKIQQLYESGVVLLIGTDSGIPMNFHSQTTWRELDAWVNEFKIDPMVAIRSATYWPSVAMKVSDQIGTVSEGKYADIIAVRGDVLRHINLLQNVDIVIKHGRRVK